MSQPSSLARSKVAGLCAEFDIKVVPKIRYPQPGETRAVATIARIIDKRGEEHTRLVLSALGETRGNNALIDEVTLWAVSDLFLACADIVEDDISTVLDLFDQLPFGPLIATVNELQGIVPQRPALAGVLYLYMRNLRGAGLTARRLGYTKVRRLNASEIEKGRGTPVRLQSSRRSVKEKIEIGRRLLAKKAEMGIGGFMRWVTEESGVTYDMALKCMKLAREADEAEAKAA